VNAPVIASVRQRPLLIVGEIAREIEVADTGAVHSRAGGFGRDVAVGAECAGGDYRALLLSGGERDMERLSMTKAKVFESKMRFELIHCPPGRFHAVRRPGSLQLDEMREALDNERGAALGSHVHLAGLAVTAAIQRERDGTWSASATVSCSQVAQMSSRHTSRLPKLLFLAADCQAPVDDCLARDRCPALAAVASGRVVIHDCGRAGVCVVVDGEDHVSFASDSLPCAGGPLAGTGALAGASLVGLRAGMCIEEAVASALLLRDPAHAMVPDAIVKMREQPRVARVLELSGALPCRSESFISKVAVGLLVMRGGRLLVGTKPDEKALVKGRLYLPGGKLERGESARDAASRELLEETGLEAKTLHVCGYSCYREEGCLYRFVQYLVTAEGDARALDDMSTLEWRPPEDIAREELFSLTWTQLFLLRESGEAGIARAL
jgi:8-oxo-dGTP pyrophosphatase MutT (NUDIX family)